MRKRIFNIIASAAVCGMVGCMSANAASVDDVASVARDLGFPESYIQQGYNQYYEDPDKYTPEVLDNAIAQLYDYQDSLKEQLGISNEPTEAPATQPATQPVTVPDTQPATQGGNSQGGNSSGSGNNSSTGVGNNSAPNNSGNNGNNTGNNASGGNSDAGSVPNSGGTVQGGNSQPANNSAVNAEIPNKPDKQTFINMTLEEKRDYISQLEPSQQQAFFNGLSAEELNSIVKQLPADDKIGVLDNFVNAGEAMGIKVTVDSISDDGISMTMRNDKGELVDVAALGMAVENTGYDYRGVFAASLAMLAGAAAALFIVVKKCFTQAESRG